MQRERAVSRMAFGHDQRTARRFFQGLQERVGCLWLQAVGIVNDGDLAAGEQGPALDRMLEFPDLIDDNAPRL